jgi:hypothetical protein
MKKVKFNHGVGSQQEFYKAVGILNKECGHGNWTMSGRPLRKVKKVEMYNRYARICSTVPFDNPPPAKLRTYDLTIVVPESKKSVQSRLLLEQV